MSELAAMPPSGAVARAAVLGALRRSRPADLDGTILLVRGVRIDPEHLWEYTRICGFGPGDAAPSAYLHVLAFPLAMRVMTARSFPLRALGLVHVANTITQTRPVAIDDRLDLSVRAADLRPHERGSQVDLIATAQVGGHEVWREVSTYLHRVKAGTRDSTASPPEPRVRRDAQAATPEGEPAVTLRLTREVGVEYARVSGDRNPIHTSRLGARAFGFPGPIAHGMWTMARCLSMLQDRLPASYRADVAFKRPIPLPSTIALRERPAAGGQDLDVSSLDSGKTHLTGAVRPLP